MKKVNPKLMIVYLFVMLSMTFSVQQLGIPSVFANEGGEGSCCTTSSTCGTDTTITCKDPAMGERACSPSDTGYCR